jgi:hypothetical protein
VRRAEKSFETWIKKVSKNTESILDLFWWIRWIEKQLYHSQEHSKIAVKSYQTGTQYLVGLKRRRSSENFEEAGSVEFFEDV